MTELFLLGCGRCSLEAAMPSWQRFATLILSRLLAQEHVNVRCVFLFNGLWKHKHSHGTESLTTSISEASKFQDVSGVGHTDVAHTFAMSS